MKKTEIISEIIELESKITKAVSEGHRPHNEDKFAKDRERILHLREILKEKS